MKELKEELIKFLDDYDGVLFLIVDGTDSEEISDTFINKYHIKEPVKQDKDIRIIQCKLCKSNITCSFHGPNINNNCKYYIKNSNKQ
jgi:hypothetical protein